MTVRARPLLWYFVLVFLVTWSVAAAAILAPDWFAARFGPLDSTSPMFFLAVYAPSLVGIALTAIYRGKAGLKELFSRLDPRRPHPIWYLVVIGGFLALTGFVAGAATVIGGHVPVLRLAAAPVLLIRGVFLDPGPLGEELGWRGFALPRMLARWSPARSSLLLGVIWGLWHLPAFYLSSLSQSSLSLPIFLLGAISLSVITCWLFLRTHGSVLITILAHAMANHALDVTGATFNQLTVGLVAVAGLLLATGSLRTAAVDGNPLAAPVTDGSLRPAASPQPSTSRTSRTGGA